MTSERKRSVSDARGQGKDYGRLSDLHPAGFSHVSRALLHHPEAHAVHMGVFAAIAETARGLPDATSGYRWIASGVSRARLRQVTGIRKPETLRGKIRDLERWGFINELRRPNVASDFEILATDLLASESHDPGARAAVATAGVSDDGVLQAAPDTHQGRTKQSGVSDIGVLRSPPPVHQDAAKDPGVTGYGALPIVDDSASRVEVTDERTPGVSEHQGGAPADDGVLPSLIDGRLDKTCRCAEPHPPFIDHQQYMTLKKSNKRSLVDAAIKEVAFRLGNPSIAPEIDQPYTMVRNIAECYGGRCRTKHGELHGEKALMYHRGRRADIEQVLRSKGGMEPDPGSLGPLQNILGDLFADAAVIEDERETHEQRRTRFVAALQQMQQEEKSR